MSNPRQRQDLEHAFIEHRGRLHEAARRIVGTRDLAEDVLQSAYLRITDAPGEWIIRQPLNYCFQIVRHVAIDYSRRRTLESQFFAAEVEGHGVPAPQLSPERTAMAREFLTQVGAALARLPARTQRAFVLHRLDGLTQRAIADELGVSPTLVNFMIRDATAALKHCAYASAT